MLINLNGPLKGAEANNRAVGAFNVYNGITIRAVIAASLNQGCPAIAAFGASYLPFISLEEVYGLTCYYSELMGQDTVLHLDHCSDLSVIESALKTGFTSVMIDGSRLPFEENLKVTKEAVRMARHTGAAVEAELGSLSAGIDSHEGEASDQEKYTDPKQAVSFVQKSGVDALAVSIGTVHGFYASEPDIRIDILEDIHRSVPVPLVLHGASGTPIETIQACIARGIRKINVNSEISRDAKSILHQESAQDKLHFSELFYRCGELLEERMGSFIRSFCL